MKSLAMMVVLVVFLLIAGTAACLGGLGIFFLRQSMTEFVDDHEETKIEDYRTEIKSQVQSAMAIVQGYYDKASNGELSEKKAQGLQKKRFAICAIAMMHPAIYGLMVQMVY